MKIFYLIICFFVLSCNSFKHPKPLKNDEDAFYTDSGDWDVSRIPILKPYELLKLKGRMDWEMALQTPMISVAIHNILGIAIIDSFIIVHSGETNLRGGTKVNEAWFIISPKDKIEKGFSKQRDFEKELNINHFTSEIFSDPNKIYSYYIKNKKINWKVVSN